MIKKKSNIKYVNTITPITEIQDITDTPTDDVIKKYIKQQENTNSKDILIEKEQNILKNKEKKEQYKRPAMTYTDKLSKIQIGDYLIDYEKIKDVKELNDVQPGTHIRYFEMKNGELKFRTGGTLTVKTGLPDYIILANGNISWSVQVKPCIFYKRITIKQIKEEYEGLILEKNSQLIGLHKIIKEQSTTIKDLKETIKKLKNS